MHRPIDIAREDPDLSALLSAVEVRLAALGEALRRRDSAAIEAHAGELHGALARAVDRFAQAARQGAIAPELRQRLAVASARVAAQREALVRATAHLDRAIDVLLPRQSGTLYVAPGAPTRAASSGAASA
jgi:hypothetical protein